MRRLIAFPCAGETLIGTLDTPPSAGDGKHRAGLLIVSGGNEIRSGAHRGMAMLADRLAASGIPVFRFDRRGIGDSTGENQGFRSSAADIAAAVAAFRDAVPLDRLVAFGNCDAASALALFGRAAGIDAVILANPWVIEPIDDLPPPAAIRARYARRLRDPAALLRLVTGGVSLPKLVRGVRRLATPARTSPSTLDAIAAWADAATIILATGDATALAYADAAQHAEGAARVVKIDTASHSFADTAVALEAAIQRLLIDDRSEAPNIDDATFNGGSS